jgi:hypothetical protein
MAALSIRRIDRGDGKMSQRVFKQIRTIALMFSALWASAPLHAQAPPPTPTPAASQAAAREKIARWFDMQNATLNLRYRVIDNGAGVVTTNQLQHRESLRARIKADPAGRYAVNFGLFTGPRFNSGWDNTPIGISDTQRNLAFKQLFFAAQPVAGVEGQVGGLYILRGESTEITTYDEDGYIMGERISVRRPKDLYFDEISLTNANLNPDPARIGVSHRFRDFDQPNYRQFLVDKKFGKRARASTDFTADRGARIWRQSLNIKTPELHYVDTVIFENYERVHPDTEYGFALSIDKAVTRKLSFNGGYASIDSRFGGLNSDRFNSGNRVFLTTTYVVSPRVTASYYITTAVGRNPTLPLRTMSNLVVGYNVLADLRRTGLF